MTLAKSTGGKKEGGKDRQPKCSFTITEEILIVNKPTDTLIYNLHNVSMSESEQFDNLLS